MGEYDENQQKGVNIPCHYPFIDIGDAGGISGPAGGPGPRWLCPPAGAGKTPENGNTGLWAGHTAVYAVWYGPGHSGWRDPRMEGHPLREDGALDSAGGSPSLAGNPERRKVGPPCLPADTTGIWRDQGLPESRYSPSGYGRNEPAGLLLHPWRQ